MSTLRSAFSSTLFIEGLKKVFFLEYSELDTVHPQIYVVETSNKRQETYHTVPSLGMLTAKQEGVSMDFEDLVDGYEKTLTHTTYAKGIRISEELMEDEMYGVIAQRTKALARSANRRKEYDHALLFNSANATTYYTGGDGLELLSNSHTIAGNPAVTYDNYAASTDLSFTAIDDARAAMRRFPEDTTSASGLPLGLVPKILLVPPELETTALELVNSDKKPGTGDNEINVLKGKLEVVVWDYITDTNAWFLLADKKIVAPVSFTRRALRFDKDTDFVTQDLLASASTRYSNGFVDPRFCYGSMGSS